MKARASLIIIYLTLVLAVTGSADDVAYIAATHSNPEILVEDLDLMVDISRYLQ